MLRRGSDAVNIGRYEITLLSDGSFALDGGAMFGTVPKTLWCRHHPADEKNRIPLALGCLLIRTPQGRNILVDTGLSSKYDQNAKFRDIYKVERPTPLLETLRAQGLSAGNIDLVINTHLHFDHAGGNTEFDASGKPQPAFPRARYLIQRDEWQDALNPHERNRASYMSENFGPLEKAGLLELVSGDYEVEPGIKVIRSGGHTRGHQCVLIESSGQAGLYLGDLVPTRTHVPLPYVMGYDLYPMDTLEAKRSLFTQAAEKNWTLLFQHDIQKRLAKVENVDGRFVAVEISSD